MSRLRGGELLALGGAVLLLVALFLDWFGLSPPDQPATESDGILNLLSTYSVGSMSGWNTLGWLVLAIAAAAIAAAGWLVLATVGRRAVAQVVKADVIAAVLGLVALVVLAARAVIFQPGPNELVGPRYGAWLGLAGAALLTVGAWWALADERTGAADSAYTPPPARPAPPERAS